MRRIILISFGVVLAAGCVTGNMRDTRASSPHVFFGMTDCGEGLYLINLSKPNTSNDPHFVLTNCTTNLHISIEIANGYKSEMLLRSQNDGVIRINNVSCYDRNGSNIFQRSGLEARWFTAFPYHLKYENLRSELNIISNQVHVCGCGYICYTNDYELKFLDAAMIIMPPSMGRTLVLPDNTSRIELDIVLTLEYVVIDRIGRQITEVPIRVRAIRKKDGQPESPAYSAPPIR